MKIPTLTREGCRNRRMRLLEAVHTDLIVISDPRNLYYYSGFLPPFPSLSEWGPVYLVLDGESGESTLICHNFAAGSAEKSFADQNEIWTWYDASVNSGIQMYSNAAKILGDFIGSRDKSGTIAIEAGHFPYTAQFRDLNPTDISSIISGHRRKKDPDEIACIRYAQDSALAGHEAARKEIRPGMTELDLYNLIAAAMTAKAGQPVKLIGDIISGPRTLQGDGPPTNRVIEENDTVILDLSPVVGGYRADYTATIVLDPNPGKKILKLEKALHAAIEAGEAQLYPGKTGREVHAAVKSCLNSLGFGEGFGHHAGHGLGLGHPEAPYFVSESDETLVAGDVVTLEPGSYMPGCAGRIEHVYLITPDEPERLTHHNTEFTL